MVFGEGKNGKSTMLNALLGENLLPCGDITCTGNITKLTKVGPDGAEKVRLHNKRTRTWSIKQLSAPHPELSRVKEEWVMDPDIDVVEVQHKHPIFRKNVTIWDVPGLNQDDDRDEAISMAMSQCHMLLVTANAMKGTFTKREQEALEKWKEQLTAVKIFVVCNRMDQIAVSKAPILKEEAVEILASTTCPLYAGMPTPEARMAAATALVSTLPTSAAIDATARAFKKPDPQKVMDEVEGVVRRLFPATARNAVGKTIHFVSSLAALTPQLAEGIGELPPEFEAMRDALFGQLERYGMQICWRPASKGTELARVIGISGSTWSRSRCGQSLLAAVESRSLFATSLWIRKSGQDSMRPRCWNVRLVSTN
jgi:GTPase SAR1 family protein